MARYSSDSDSERNKYRKKHSRRSRSCSAESSDSTSSYQKRSSKHSKGRKRHRSRSRSRERDRSSRNYSKHSRGNSRDRDRRRYRRSRSSSLERIKSKRRSFSREKSSSNSSGSQLNVKSTEKPAQFISKDIPVSGDPSIRASVLTDINNDEFVPKSFTSSRSNKSESKTKNIVIDISADTIHVPESSVGSSVVNSIFHSGIAIDREARFDRWVKKLYSLRQKALVDAT